MTTAFTKKIRTRTREGSLARLLKCPCNFLPSKANASRCESNSKERRSRTSSLTSTRSSSSWSSSSSVASAPSALALCASQPSTSLKVHFTKPKTAPGWKFQSTSLSFSLTMSRFLRRGMFLYQKSCTKGLSVEFSSLHWTSPRVPSPLRALISTPLRGENASSACTFTPSMGMRCSCRLCPRLVRRGSGSASELRKSVSSSATLMRDPCFLLPASTVIFTCKEALPSAAKTRGISPSKPFGWIRLAGSTAFARLRSMSTSSLSSRLKRSESSRA
mmetsp:Transcript_7976/g.25169  ORF Transcript_7976/g.25169 Transcript_7976/m.25169 type:complete len:275 (-) Transcript_7976:939-1763(-)